MSFRVIIPARYASTRLPGKPLLDIAGKPMLQHVFERALESGAAEVVIATDDNRIRAAAEAFGAPVCMTAAHHRSGSERLAEVVAQLGYGSDEVIVNLQGDEPLMPPALLRQVAAGLMEHPAAPMATLCTPIDTARELFDPNVVKVVTDAQGYALYFSRAPIPWDRDAQAARPGELPAGVKHYRHLGIYAYRAGFLARYVGTPACELETRESLEQLRVLWMGEKIHVAEAAALPGPGVDTPADLEKVRLLVGA
ncbi:MAG: 3-deoxy-manno-octulosonate cytidylyltransferase [Thiohalomonadaceae bacterium]